jgi:tRNA (guanine26-N2/guanine27-N2)-dimethyltransferase
MPTNENEEKKGPLGGGTDDAAERRDAPSSSLTTTTATTTITEGSVVMHVPETKGSNNGSKGGSSGSAAAPPPAQDVFYNPVQVQNRDLSLLMLALHWERRISRHGVKTLAKQLRKQQQPNGMTKEEIQQHLDRFQSSLKEKLPCAASADEAVRAASSASAASTAASTSAAPSALPPPPYRVLDALAASGLRSLRYWKELRGRIDHIRINDMDSAAVLRAQQNLKDNMLESVVVVSNDDADHNSKDNGSSLSSSYPHGIRVQQGDAIDVLYRTRSGKPWSSIDLDPYGSAAPFLDGAIQAVENGGMLCVTCTDMAALGGSHPETCFGRYHAFPLQRSGYLQEMALRILLYSIATTAAKYGRSIRPVLSVGMDFYVRVWVEIEDSKADVKDLSLHVGHVYQSTKCPSFKVVPSAVMGGASKRVFQAGRVPATMTSTSASAAAHDNEQQQQQPQQQPQDFEIEGDSLKLGGPMWLGRLHDPDVVRAAMDRLQAEPGDGAAAVIPDVALLATRERMLGLLESCRDELPDVPLYYKLPDLCSTLAMSCIPRRSMESAIVNAGYRVSGYHKEPQAIKTDAPNVVMWDILRTWHAHVYSKEEEAGKRKASADGSVAHQILSTPVATPNISFSPPPPSRRPGDGSSLPSSSEQQRRFARFPMNPQPHWGPKARAASSSGNRKRKAAGGGAAAATDDDNDDDDESGTPATTAAPAAVGPSIP